MIFYYSTIQFIKKTIIILKLYCLIVDYDVAYINVLLPITTRYGKACQIKIITLISDIIGTVHAVPA